jgi:hypothetical protein
VKLLRRRMWLVRQVVGATDIQHGVDELQPHRAARSGAPDKS